MCSSSRSEGAHDISARYFLHLRHRDRFYADEEGDELPDETAVRPHALRTASDLIRFNRTDLIRDWFDCTFEITDEAGRVVLTMPFGDVVTETPQG